MRTIVHLNARQRKEIQKKLRHRDGHQVWHALMILLLSHFKPERVAKMLNCSLSNLYKRAMRFHCEGQTSFGHRTRLGRPPEWEAKHDACLRNLLARTPRDEGFATNLWTTQLLAAGLLARTGWRFSTESVRKRLQTLGYRWKRPKQAPTQSADPLAEEKLAKIEAARQEAAENPDMHLLHVDGADFNLLNTIRTSWSLKGHQAEYPTPGTNKKIFALGAFEPASKRFLFQVSYRKRSIEFIAFLKHLLKRYSGKLFVILDNVRTQKTERVQSFVAKHSDRLELLFIPSYSPQYNQPIERIWGNCRAWVNGNASCFNLTELRRKTISGLRRQQTLLRLAKAL